MLHQYELKVMKPGETKMSSVIWEGENGIDACHRYANSHPGHVVWAWKDYPQHGIFLVHPSQIIG